MVSPDPIAVLSRPRRPLVHELVVCGDFRICFPPEPHSICFAVLEPGLPVFAIQTCAAISVLLSFRILQGRLGDLAPFTAFRAHDAVTPMPVSVVYVEDPILGDRHSDAVFCRVFVAHRHSLTGLTTANVLTALSSGCSGSSNMLPSESVTPIRTTPPTAARAAVM